MKKIKIRAWDKINEKYWFLDKIWNNNWYDCDTKTFHKEGSIGGTLPNNNRTISPLYYSNNFILDYSIGLKDEEDNIIYNNDYLIDDNNILYKIKWCQEYCKYDLLIYDGIGEFMWNGDIGRDYDVECGILKGFTVVGNINENPEFL